MALVEEKAREGGLRAAQPLPGEEVGTETSAEVIDLTELLRRSLRGTSSSEERAAPAKKASAKTAEKAAEKAAKPSPARRAANDEAPARPARTRAAAAAKTSTTARTATRPAARRKGG
jgi:DNA end-binding protein Ku